MMRTLQLQFKLPEKESILKCGSERCEKNTRYVIFYDFIYDRDVQLVLCALRSNRCEKHGKHLMKTLKEAKKEFQVIDLIFGKEKVQFT